MTKRLENPGGVTASTGRNVKLVTSRSKGNSDVSPRGRGKLQPTTGEDYTGGRPRERNGKIGRPGGIQGRGRYRKRTMVTLHSNGGKLTGKKA